MNTHEDGELYPELRKSFRKRDQKALLGRLRYLEGRIRSENLRANVGREVWKEILALYRVFHILDVDVEIAWDIREQSLTGEEDEL